MSSFIINPYAFKTITAGTGDPGAGVDENKTTYHLEYRLDTENTTGWKFIGSSSSRVVGIRSSRYLQMFDWNGTVLSTVGSELDVGASLLSTSVPNQFDIMDNTNNAEILVFAVTSGTSDSIRGYTFNGSVWSALGGDLTISPTNNGYFLATVNSTDVVLLNPVDDSVKVYRWGGSSWTQQGSTFTITGMVSGDSATFLGDGATLVFGDGPNLEAYTWNGSTFSATGTNLNIGNPSSRHLARLNSTDFFIRRTPSGGTNPSDRNRVERYNWDGSVFTEVTGGFDSVAFVHSSNNEMGVLDADHLVFSPGRKVIGVYKRQLKSVNRNAPDIDSICAWWDMTLTASYDGTLANGLKNVVQTPADGASQSDYDMHFGTTSGVEAADPSVGGTTNSPYNYASGSGSQLFTLKGAISNCPALRDWHKTTSQFWIMIYTSLTTGATDSFAGNISAATDHGIFFDPAGGDFAVNQANGTTMTIFDFDSNEPNSTQMIAVVISVDLSKVGDNCKIWSTYDGIRGLTESQALGSRTFLTDVTDADGVFNLLAANGTGILNAAGFVCAGFGNGFLEQSDVDKIATQIFNNTLTVVG